MRHLLAASLISVAVAGCAWADGPPVNVHGKAQRSGVYCGGAAPPKSLVDHLAKPRVTTERFDVLRGKSGSTGKAFVSFMPDASGNFSIKLPPGDYCVIEAGKRDRPKNGYDKLIDASCEENFRNTCSLTWRIGPQDTDVSFTLSDMCQSPCYRGPLRP